jgi:hypothetical protein
MKKTLLTIVSLLLLSGACWSDDTETNANEAKYYDNAKVVRIKSVEGEGFVKRSYEEGDEEATADLPLFEKDTVGTTDGRLAVYLGRLNYLRLDADSVVVLEKVPQLRRTDLTVRLEQGSIYLDIENLDREKGIEIQTADCGIFLLDKGVYRVNSGVDGRTEVIVLEGLAEVAGDEDSRNVRENQKIVMVRGNVEERPYYFYASDKDDFDNWNEGQNREQGYARYGTSRYLQSGYEDYEYEMSRAGRWTYMSEFNSYGWTPNYANSDWRPYDNGRWVWNPYYGYVWTSYDTCGWFTHHYGRWNWSYNGGWCWIPSYHWSPAWVSWFGDSNYYGWSPLSWWNRPIVIINNRWDRNFDYHRGIPHHSRSTIIIRKNELSAANIHRVVLNRDALGQNAGGTIAYRGSAPDDRPALNKVTVINARGRSVTYKQGAVVSGEKYRVQGSDIKSGVYRYTPADGGMRAVPTTRKSADEASGASFRSRSGSETTRRVRYTSGSESSSGNSGGSSKVDGSTGGSGSGKSSYRSKSGSSGSSSSTSSSSSSSSSGSTARKKKKGEPSYLTRSNSDYSSGTQAGVGAPAAGYRSKISSGNGYSYRSYGSSSTSQGSQGDYASGSSSRRTIGSIISAGKNSGYSGSGYGSGPGRSGDYGSVSRSSYRPSTFAPSYSRPSSGSYSPISGGHASSGSSSTTSGSRAYTSGSSHSSASTSGSSHSSSSSSSSSSGSHRAVKKN